MTDQTIANRIAEKSGVPDLVDILAQSLTASELNSLLIEVFRRRASATTPNRLLHQYEHNKFTAPAAFNMVEFMAFELSLLRYAQDAGSVPIELSPVSPLGTCAAIATVDQNKVMSALRGTEVVADATNVLALESSVKRREALRHNPRSTERFRFCTVHRHLRTPPIPKLPGFSQHFRIFCLTTAGRDEGSFVFEQETLVEHISLYIGFLKQLGVPPELLQIVLKSLRGTEDTLFGRVREALALRLPGIQIEEKAAEQDNEQYYRGINFKISAVIGGAHYELADGGVVDWTQKLLGNNKERFVISGIGTERLFSAMDTARAVV